MEKDLKTFEEKLLAVSKPSVVFIRHQDLLAREIVKSKDQAILSIWWLFIPLYLLGMLIMKSMYIHSNFGMKYIQEFIASYRYFSLIIFNLLPIGILLSHFITIRKLYLFYGKPNLWTFLIGIWVQILVVVASLIIIIFYYV